MVTAWQSQAAYDLSGIQNTASQRPVWMTGQMNFNPVVRFDGVDDGLFIANNNTAYMSQFTDRSQFIVMRTVDTGGTISTIANSMTFSPTSCEYSFNLSGGRITGRLS